MHRLLFVCTHNRCRSILAEAICHQAANDIFDIRSAGSQPAGVVFPGTIAFLQQQGIDCSELSSQSWDDHQEFAPEIVITVCDSAAGEACPVWLGQAARVHWGLPDPSKLDGDEQQRTFIQVARVLEERVQYIKAGYSASLSVEDVQQLFNDACSAIAI